MKSLKKILKNRNLTQKSTKKNLRKGKSLKKVLKKTKVTQKSIQKREFTSKITQQSTQNIYFFEYFFE